MTAHSQKVPRLLFAGTGSGSGKTTVTCAFLLALKKRGLDPAAFKCGPDYIDPMFHTQVLGVPSRNLDIFLCGEDVVQHLLAINAEPYDMAVLEGVMGLYDGVGQGSKCSSNHVAVLTETPTVLVVHPKGQAISLVAELYGYQNFLPNTVQGIILNKTSKRMYEFYKEMIERELGLRVYGYLPAMAEVRMKSQRLGLVPPAAVAELHKSLEKLALTADETLDMEGLVTLAHTSQPMVFTPPSLPDRISHTTDANAKRKVRVGVAKDEAFCFYYEDSLALLRLLGAEIIEFSPLHDTALPDNIDGLLLGGGYQEEYAEKLSCNSTMRASYAHAIKQGLPVIAEGGGFLYLGQSFTNEEGAIYPMVGALPNTFTQTHSLQCFGYCTLTAERNNFVCPEGSSFPAHEFHYTFSDDNGDTFTAAKDNGKKWPCVHTTEHIFAGFPQFHWWGCRDMAVNFVQACEHYRDR